MGSRLVLHYVCLMFLLACITEVQAAKNIFNVKRYGAVADGKTDISKVFGNVFTNACQSEGENVIVFPLGTYLLLPLVLKGPCKGSMELLITGTLQASTDISSFLNIDHWITFQHINQLVLSGGGTLDGQGASAWGINNCIKDPNCKALPISLRFDFINNSRISHLTSINSKNAHMNIFACNNVRIDNIKISEPADSPNTDGIHIGSSSDIEIINSVIGTGDDCVSMSPGSKNIQIRNVECGPGHGISVGSLGGSPNEEDVSGLFVTNCTFIGTDNGVRIKTRTSSYSSNVFNLTYENINMENVNNPIVIDQQYCPGGKCQKGASLVQIRDVLFRNIWGSSSSKIAVNFACSPIKPCDKIMLKDINLAYNGVIGGVAASSCSNAKFVAFGQQKPRLAAYSSHACSSSLHEHVKIHQV